MTEEKYDGPDRRIDHDLLIGMARDLKHLCRKQDTYRNEVRQELSSIHSRIDEQTKSCNGRVADCNKLFVSSQVFYTALLILVGIITGLGTVAYETRTDFVRHKGVATEVRTSLENRLDKLDSHVNIPSHNDVYDTGEDAN